MTDYFNQLVKILEPVARKHDLSKVFNAFLTVSICSFHQTNIQSRLQQKDKENEALYLETIKPYERDELSKFGEALGVIQLNVLDNSYSDILGEFFMLYITKGQNGQYFTPMPICELMTRIQGGLENEGNRVLDPACGSGRMLLSYAKTNHRNYFFGADNSSTCAKMATLNFFLNGLNGEVAWMNSLSMEWYGGWHINTNGLGIIPIEKEHSTIWTKVPEPKPMEFSTNSKTVSNEPAHQLTLF